MDNSGIEKLLEAKGVKPTSNRILVIKELCPNVTKKPESHTVTTLPHSPIAES